MWPRLFLIALMLVLPVGAAHAASNDCFATASAPTYEEGKSAPCSVTLDGKVRVDAAFSGEITGADGAITDGATPAIKATVKDYTNSNPLTVIPVDTNGDPATLGGGTQYQQGTASTTTDTMNMLGCVRVDTPAVASGVIDGDRARCIVDSTNRIWVHVGVIDGTVAATQSGTWNIGTLTSITNPVAVTGTFWQATQPVSGTVTANAGTGNFTVVQGTGTNLHVVCDSGCSSSAGFADNSAFTFGTTAINPIGGVLDDTSTNTATENSAAVARITAQKALHMNLRNNSGTEIGTSGAPVRTDPTGSTTQPVSGTVSITANSAVNVAQMNGVNTSMGVGASGTGTQRVASLIHDGTDTAQVTSTSGGSLQVECAAGCSGGTQYDEDTAHVSGDKLTLSGFVRQDSDGPLAADGDRSVGQVDANGYIKVVNKNPNLAADNSTLSTAKVPVMPGTVSTSAPTWTNGNQSALSLQTDGSVRAAITNTVAITANSSINNAQLNGSTIQVASNSLNTTGAGLQATAMVGQCDDTSPTSLTENQFGHARINCTTHHQLVEVGAALPTGSNTIGGVNLSQYTPASGRLPVDPSGVTSPVSMATNTPVGNVAHDAADSGAPLKTGGKATTSISAKTMVANDDRTDNFSGIDGVPIVRLHANLEDRVNNTVGITDGSSTSLVAAQGSGIRFCATTLIVSNSSATNVTVDIRDGTAGSVLMTIPAAGNMGGAVLQLPIPLCTTANTAMAADPSAAATTVAISAIGFKTKL